MFSQKSQEAAAATWKTKFLLTYSLPGVFVLLFLVLHLYKKTKVCMNKNLLISLCEQPSHKGFIEN